MTGSGHASREQAHDRFYGLYPATVTALEGDPQAAQRVKVALDWLPLADGSGPAEAWATVVSPYAGADQGIVAAVILAPEVAGGDRAHGKPAIGV